MTTNKPMQPPARQPIGFWTARAGEAIQARIRGALHDIGVTQPEWWLLHQLSLSSGGVNRAETVEKIGHNDTPQVIEEAIVSAINNGWIEQSGSKLRYTDAGADLFRRANDVQQMLQDERMRGISEADFVTTIEVLQRTIQNVGGDAWHW
ncbi:MAG: MarR family winged helix-turn-helix transcriptional regulator [Rhodococcus sp. (in: high G+C Gram-positive bacteria)]